MKKFLINILLFTFLLPQQNIWAQCTPGALDSDNDGICDIEDKDDDNDGILDDNETKCIINLSNMSFYGNAISSVTGNSITLNNTGNAWESSYSNDTISLPIYLDYIIDINENKMIGFLPIGANETITNWNDAGYKLYTNTNNILYGKLTHSWDFNTSGIDGKLCQLSIDQSGKLTVKLDGTILFTRIIPVTDYRLAISTHSGGAFNQVNLSGNTNGCIIEDLDTDEDNIPNRLDLDSDGDLCVDAFEGSLSFGLNDMDANGRLIGPVQTDATNAFYGVPLIIQETAQGIGESTTINTLLNDVRACFCIQSNNPTDSDNDGICNTIDSCPNLDNNLIGTSCNDGDSNTINDIYTSSCNCAGSPICDTAALDSDFDGICDIDDKDDDNDGIKDVNETTYGINLNSLTMLGDAVESIEADKFALTNFNNTWRYSYSQNIFALPLKLSFKANTSNYSLIGFLPVNAVQTEGNTYVDGAYKLFTHINGRVYGKMPNVWTFSNADINDKFIQMTVSIEGSVNVLLEGDTVYSGIMPVADYRLAVNSYNGGSIDQLKIESANMPSQINDLDSDNDNIPNRLDLDSDNDLCVDAYEGDADFELIDMDANGRLLGGVNVAQGSPLQGVPLVAGVDGQGFGLSKEYYAPLIENRACLCIASNNPTDADNDGICDAIDNCINVPNNLIGTSCDDGNVNTINDVWTSSCNCEGIIACATGNLNSDNDGICDIEDKDDDNDGIKDDLETICSISLSDITMYGNAVTSITQDSIELANNNAWRSSYSNNILSLPLYIEYKINTDYHSMIGFNPINQNEIVNNWNDGAYKLYTNQNGTLYGKVPGQWNFSTGNVNGKKVSLNIDTDGCLTVKLNEIEIYTGNAPVSDYKFVVSSHSGGSIKEVAIRYGNLPCTTFDIDTDSDGIPNRIDLDSDNDLCVDAYEGDANFELNDMNGIGQLLGNVEQNAQSQNYGIPLSAAAGQLPGSSLEVYEVFPDIRKCLCIASNNPTDSDNDGVCDLADLCSTIPDNLIGTACNDGDACTINDVYNSNCLCEGTFLDSDGDNICDNEDICPNFDNEIDIDNDNIADCIDNCIDVNEDDICDNLQQNWTYKYFEVFATHRRGFYYNAFNLNLMTNAPNATIYYTTDGSIPSSSSVQYIGNAIPINVTTTLRSIAITPQDTSTVNTHSYIFIDDIISQPYMKNHIVDHPLWSEQLDEAFLDIPSISIVTSNTIDEMEKVPISVEFFFPNDNKAAIQTNSEAKHFGRASLNFEKKSIRLYFDSLANGDLDYPVLEGFDEGVPVTNTFDRLDLRSDVAEGFQSTNSSQNYIGPRFGDRTMLEMGSLTTHGRFAHLYVNGEYVGQYHLRERLNDGFMRSYFGGNKSDYEAINLAGSGNLGGNWDDGIATDGTGEMWETLAASADSYAQWSQLINVDNYFDFMLIYMYGYHENESKTAGNLTGDSKFIFRVNDGDFFFSRYEGVGVDRTDPNGTDGFNAKGHRDMFKRLYNEADPNFFMRFSDRVECSCFNGGALSTTAVQSRINELADEMRLSIIAESARWADANEHPNYWESEIADLQNDFAPYRTDTLIEQLKNRNLYPNLNAVQFSQYGGLVQAGSQLTLSNPNQVGEIYYTTNGEDPRLSGGAINPNAQLYVGAFSLTNGVYPINARVRQNNTWSAMCPSIFYVNQNYDDLVINEIHYNPIDSIFFNSTINANDTIGGKNFEFIELTNNGNMPIHLFGAHFNRGITYKMEELLVVEPGGFLVIAEDAFWFEQKYGFAPDGVYTGKLDNGGESLVIKDPFNNVIDSVKYDDSSPWDDIPDDGIYSLALINAANDNNDPSNWSTQIISVTPRSQNLFCAPITTNEFLIPINCGGTPTGSIIITTAGGTAPFSYQWSNGMSGSAITGLVAGTYQLTTTDAFACEKIDVYVINEPAVLQLSEVHVNESFVGENDGVINLAVVGGTTPYTYNWSNGATNQDVNNLAAGIYTVTVTDANNCTETLTVTIQPGQVVCAIPNNIAATNIQNTSATLSWSNDANANNYEVQYREVGAFGWTTFTSNFAFAIMNNLNICTEYEVRIKSNCSTGQNTAYSNIYNFTSNGCVASCAPVIGLFSQNVTSSSAFLVWDIVPNASYTLYYRKIGNAQWFTYQSAFPIAILFSLPACSDFEWFVEVNCVDGNNSVASPIKNFTTIGAACKLGNIEINNELSIYPNPVNDILNIKLPIFDSNIQLEVIDMNGKILISRKISQYEIFYPLDVSKLSGGSYQLRVNNSFKNFIKK